MEAKRNVKQETIDKVKQELPLIHKIALANKEYREAKDWVASTKAELEACGEYEAHKNAKNVLKEATEDLEELLKDAEEEVSKSQLKIQFRNN